MKLYGHEILKRNLQFILFVVSFFVFVVSTCLSIAALRSASNALIIGIDANGTRVVTNPVDPIFKTEVTVFIQKFLMHTYCFDSQNFYKRLGLATSLMSESLWKSKENELLDLRARVDRDKIELRSEILQMTKEDDSTYHALLQVYEKARLNEQSHKVHVSLKVKRVKRDRDNPYGLEVDSYEESTVLD